MATQAEFLALIEVAGCEVVSTSTKQAGDYLDREFVRWAKVVKDRNIKAE